MSYGFGEYKFHKLWEVFLTNLSAGWPVEKKKLPIEQMSLNHHNSRAIGNLSDSGIILKIGAYR